MTTGTSLWRVAGLSYLQYTNKAASVLRSALKEPLKTQAEARGAITMTGFQWSNGDKGEPSKKYMMRYIRKIENDFDVVLEEITSLNESKETFTRTT